MEIRVTIGLGKNKNSSIESDVNSIAFALEMYATLYKRSQFETALVHVYGIASEHLTNARLAGPYPPLALQKWTRRCTSYELSLRINVFSLPQQTLLGLLRGAGILCSRRLRLRVQEVVAQVLGELGLRHARQRLRLEDRGVLHNVVLEGDGCDAADAATLPRVVQVARQRRNGPIAENAHRSLFVSPATP